MGKEVLDYKEIKEHYDKFYVKKGNTLQSYPYKAEGIEYYYHLSHEFGISKLLNCMHFSNFKALRMLDNGCGNGYWWYLFIDRFQIIGIDISISQLANSNLNSTLKIVANSISLPFKNSQFDLVFSSEVVEHLLPGDEKLYFRESFAVLKNNGYLILTTPNGLELRRMLQRILIKLCAKIIGKEEEYLKSKLFRIYIYI